jgi:hypothetical protein
MGKNQRERAREKGASLHRGLHRTNVGKLVKELGVENNRTRG